MLRKRLCDEFPWMDLRTGPTGFPRRTHYGSRTSADVSSLHEDTRSRFNPPRRVHPGNGFRIKLRVQYPTYETSAMTSYLVAY